MESTTSTTSTTAKPIRYYVAASIPAWREFAKGAQARGDTLQDFLAGVHPANRTNARNAFRMEQVKSQR